MATGIFMLNLGGPKLPSDVPRYLQRMFSDNTFIRIPFGLGPYVAKMRTKAVQKQYEEIGGSPLSLWTNRQGEGMCKILDEISPSTAPHKFYPCFRYSEPLSEDALAMAKADGVKRMIAFTQYPHYSCATTGNSMRELQQHGFDGSVIWRWADHPRLIETWVTNLKETLGGNTTMPILFSAHSIPASIMWGGDAYPFEIASTVYAIMKHFPNPYRIMWQSKVGMQTWLQPSTEFSIKAMGKDGVKEACLVPIAFVQEHLETLYEIDMEYVELARENGITGIKRCPAPNDHPLFLRTLAEVVKEHIDGETRTSPLRCLKCIRPDECGKFSQFS